MGDLLSIAALLLFSANAFVVRAASVRLDQEVGFLVALVANVALGVVVFLGFEALASSAFRLDLPAAGIFAVSGVFSSYLGRRGYFRTVHTIGPSRASAIQNSSPVFALALAWVFLGQVLAVLDVALMAAVVVGLFLTGTTGGSGRAGGPDRWLAGHPRVPTQEVVVALVSAAAYAVGNVFRGAAIERWDEPVFGALIGALAGTLAYFAVHVSPTRLRVQLGEAPRSGLLLWVLSGGITICGQAAVIGAIAHVPVAVAVAVSAATPLVVLPVSVLLLGNSERVNARTAVGALLIVGGVALLLLR